MRGRRAGRALRGLAGAETGDRRQVRRVPDFAITVARRGRRPRLLNNEPMAFAPRVATDRARRCLRRLARRARLHHRHLRQSLARHGATWLPQDVRIDAGEGGGLMANAVGRQRRRPARGGGVGRASAEEDGSSWPPSRTIGAATGPSRSASTTAKAGARRCRRASIRGDRRAHRGHLDGRRRRHQRFRASVGGFVLGRRRHVGRGRTDPRAARWLRADHAALLREREGRAAGVRGEDAGRQRGDLLRPSAARRHVAAREGRVDAAHAAARKASAPRLAIASGGTLYLVYVDGQEDVRLLRSKDGGGHWDPPLLVDRVRDDSGATVRFPQVAVGGGTPMSCGRNGASPRAERPSATPRANGHRWISSSGVSPFD